MEGPKVLFRINLFGGINVTDTIVASWCIILAVFILSKILTRKLSKIPTSKTQLVAEKIVTMIDSLVESTMGKKFMGYAPFILALMTFSLCGAWVSGGRPSLRYAPFRRLRSKPGRRVRQWARGL